ncbi:MAG: hypothetical protein EOP45_08345 [Sphingobacteriaceae bacterium]|nr:MAG: hypothetical protein EOP45_08345 [Sphingobacteriaceae bacterium]
MIRPNQGETHTQIRSNQEEGHTQQSEISTRDVPTVPTVQIRSNQEEGHTQGPEIPTRDVPTVQIDRIRPNHRETHTQEPEIPTRDIPTVPTVPTVQIRSNQEESHTQGSEIPTRDVPAVQIDNEICPMAISRQVPVTMASSPRDVYHKEHEQHSRKIRCLEFWSEHVRIQLAMEKEIQRLKNRQFEHWKRGEEFKVNNP